MKHWRELDLGLEAYYEDLAERLQCPKSLGVWQLPCHWEDLVQLHHRDKHSPKQTTSNNASEHSVCFCTFRRPCWDLLRLFPSIGLASTARMSFYISMGQLGVRCPGAPVHTFKDWSGPPVGQWAG